MILLIKNKLIYTDAWKNRDDWIDMDDLEGELESDLEYSSGEIGEFLNKNYDYFSSDNDAEEFVLENITFSPTFL